jgi:hypothetical protein
MGLVLNDNTEDFSIFERINFLTNIFNLERMKTSKITAVKNIKPWTGANGTTLYHQLELENGDKIELGKKTEQKVGWEVTYEITGDLGQQEFTKAKAVKPDEGFAKPSAATPTKTYVDNTKGIKIGHAITNGVSIFLSNGSYEAMDMKESIKAYAKMIHQISEELNNEL